MALSPRVESRSRPDIHTEDKSGQQIGIEGLKRLVDLPSLDAIVEDLTRIQLPAEPQDDWTLIDIRYSGK